MENFKSVCAQLTPQGRGAVAVVGVSGPQAEQALQRSFRPISGRDFSSLRNRKIVYGIWLSTNEDLIVVRRDKARFEVHCHGGAMASTAVIESLNQNDIAEVTATAYANQFVSSWLTSTQLALAEAPTVRTAKLLLRQTEILPNAIAKIDSMIENGDQNQAHQKIQSMLDWADFGIHLTQPRSVVFCGQPNVGKSSLVNAIVGFQRAIVHDVPGTTRDVVSQSTAIDGWPVTLRDTAGLRESENLIESKGVEKAKTEIESADVKICVFDGSKSWTTEDQAMLDSIEPHLIVANKMDRADPNSQPIYESENLHKTSATTGQGIENLITQIANVMVPQFPHKNQAVPVSHEQMCALRKMKKGSGA